MMYYVSFKINDKCLHYTLRQHTPVKKLYEIVSIFVYLLYTSV